MWRFSLARKELENSFQNDSESDGEWEDGLLNLAEEEGTYFALVSAKNGS